MDEIYKLIGKLMENFQKVEQNLALLVFCYDSKHVSKSNQEIHMAALKNWLSMDKATLGKKLNKINELSIFENENDTMVLDYINNQRNHIAHSFFIANDFQSTSLIVNKKKELLKIESEVLLILKALNGFLLDYAQNCRK